MNILIVGTGGREQALLKALQNHTTFDFISGSISLEKNIENWVPLLKEKQIELVVIGPEKELTLGFSDTLRKNGFLVFGPSQKASQLEGSKIFSKEFMNKSGIPTSRYKVVDGVSSVLQHSKDFSPPYVLKVDGLAGGKGVFICENLKELESKAIKVFEEKIFGKQKAILEEYQTGYELSVFILTNGKDYQILPLAQDYKRLFNHQKGPNTGGMGAIAPMEISSQLMEHIHKFILKPTVQNLNEQNLDYRGVLYIGIMVTDKGPFVLEYNVRFGDPECQVLLPLFQDDLGDIFKQIALGNLPSIHFNNEHSCCVVLSEKGYPENPKKGEKLNLHSLENFMSEKQYILHAGTQKKNGDFFINGGRVLNAIGLDSEKDEALKKAYELAEKIKSQNPTLHYRTDIGAGSL